MKNVPRSTTPPVPQQHGRSSQAKPETPTQMPSMLTIGDICQRLQISRRQVYRCIDRGHLPPPTHKLGRKTAWPTGVIEQLEATWTEEVLAEMSRQQHTIHRPL